MSAFLSMDATDPGRPQLTMKELSNEDGSSLLLVAQRDQTLTAPFNQDAFGCSDTTGDRVEVFVVANDFYAAITNRSTGWIRFVSFGPVPTSMQQPDAPAKASVLDLIASDVARALPLRGSGEVPDVSAQQGESLIDTRTVFNADGTSYRPLRVPTADPNAYVFAVALFDDSTSNTVRRVLLKDSTNAARVRYSLVQLSQPFAIEAEF